MKDQIVDELKAVINVITMLQLRESTLRDELEFFKDNYEDSAQSIWIGALKRLEHESMFLCIDACSLHQGISQKKSLYRRIIKQNAKEFTKVDKRPTSNPGNTIHLGIFSSGGHQQATPSDVDQIVKAANDIALNSRKELQKEVGIQSHKADDMDAWIDSLVDSESLEKLNKYRDRFAHRLNSLDNLKQEMMAYNPASLEAMLEVRSS